MIILDTNVISELMREKPEELVKNWITAQNQLQLAITTITIAEIKRGLFRLPKGKKRQRLETGFEAFVQQAFHSRVYSFDEEAADIYGLLAQKRESQGLHVDAVDLMIASIAKVHNAAIATRNIQDFIECDVTIFDPWST